MPFDYAPGSPLENVGFETALVDTAGGGADVSILADFTWSFSTLSGALTGLPIAFHGAATPNLLSLYAQSFPGVTYRDTIVSPTALPEPEAWLYMIAGLASTGAATRWGRRRLALGASRT